MSIDTRAAAFCEYVLRPMTNDLREILEQLSQLNIGISQATIRRTVFVLGCWHMVGEVIRGASYVAVTWIICQAVVQVWPLL